MERWEKERKEYLGSLTEILFNDKRILPYDVYECINLERMEIGPDVDEIITGIFQRCPKLKEVAISPQNKNFHMDGNCLIDKKKNSMILCMGTPRIPESIDTVFLDCFNTRARADKLFIHKNVKKIIAGESFFSIGSLEVEDGNAKYEVDSGCLFERGGEEIVLGSEQSVIPRRAVKIGRGAFSGCNLRRFEIPSHISEIGESAFYNCSQLEELAFDEGVTKMDEFAFAYCGSLKSLNLPKSLAKAGKGCFLNMSSLEKIVSFGGLSEISNRCFQGCGLKSAVVGGRIKKICDEAFWFSPDLEEFTACDGLETVGKQAFHCCENLKKVTLAHTVRELGDGAFGACGKLTDVSLSSSLKIIPLKAFFECKSLMEIDFPDGLERIESWAFYNCSRLECTNMTKLKCLKKIYGNAFTGCRKLSKEERGKKPAKLPKFFYSLESFEEIKETATEGKSYVFMSATLAGFLTKFRFAMEFEGKRYLCLNKKDAVFFAEISSETQKDDVANVYDVYCCRTVLNEDEINKLFEAAGQKGVK